MRKLKVALFVKGKPRHYERDTRIIGPWSYDVPEFEWQHFCAGPHSAVNRGAYKEFDLIWNEEGCYADWRGHGPPVVGWFWDTTWTPEHRRVRVEQGKRCDLVFIDHDMLAPFKKGKAKVRRLVYCVNDKLFKDWGEDKTLDVTEHQNTKMSPERVALRSVLRAHCVTKGYTSRLGPIGVPEEYARSFSRSKISINLPRAPANRPHRVFEVMASRACLLTGLLPSVDADGLLPGVNMATFEDLAMMRTQLDFYLETGEWRRVAEEGYKLIQERHTWAVRAREIREVLARDLGL